VENSKIKDIMHKLLHKFKTNVTAEFMAHITWCGKAGYNNRVAILREILMSKDK